MWPMMYTGYGWWNWWMMIPMILFWGLVIWGVVALIAKASRPSSFPTIGESALEVLKKRYASSEISKEEYEEKRRDIV